MKFNIKVSGSIIIIHLNYTFQSEIDNIYMSLCDSGLATISFWKFMIKYTRLSLLIFELIHDL